VLHAKTAGAKAAIPAFHEEFGHLLSTMDANASSTDECPSHVATVSVIGLGYSVCTVAAVAVGCTCAAFCTTGVARPFAIVVASAGTTAIILRAASEAKYVAAYASVRTGSVAARPDLGSLSTHIISSQPSTRSIKLLHFSHLIQPLSPAWSSSSCSASSVGHSPL
jgi:hypothetical protein